jgi:crotonobetainyl-CoA:carnitine CoA-transferase CaiB-like acyl-CoA transferase
VELREIFRQKSADEWLRLADEKNFPIAPVNTPKTIANDPQFKDRFQLYPHERHGAEMLPFPVKLVGEELPAPSRAPTVGEHNDDVLSNVLGYDADRIKVLKESGALG